MLMMPPETWGEREKEFERDINRSAPKIRQQIYMQNEHDTQVNHQEKQ